MLTFPLEIFSDTELSIRIYIYIYIYREREREREREAYRGALLISITSLQS